jgi:hypothetical protein
MVASLVRETEMCDMLEGDDGDQAYRIRCLTVATTRLWAEAYKGFHVFEIVSVIGESISRVADTLGSRLRL